MLFNYLLCVPFSYALYRYIYLYTDQPRFNNDNFFFLILLVVVVKTKRK